MYKRQIQYARETIKLARNAEKYGNDTLAKGAVLPGYYTTEEKLSQEVFDRVKEQLGQNGIGNN